MEIFTSCHELKNSHPLSTMVYTDSIILFIPDFKSLTKRLITNKINLSLIIIKSEFVCSFQVMSGV